jgi:hypothetical protein
MKAPHFNEIGNVTDDILEVQDNEPTMHVVIMDESGVVEGDATVAELHDLMFDIFG